MFYHIYLISFHRLFWIASGFRSDISFLADCFKAELGSVLTWQVKQAEEQLSGVNQGHLGLNPMHPAPPPPLLAPLLIWRENVALALPVCAVSPSFCPKHFGWLHLHLVLSTFLEQVNSAGLSWRGEKTGLMIERDVKELFLSIQHLEILAKHFLTIGRAGQFSRFSSKFILFLLLTIPLVCANSLVEHFE